MLHQKIETTDVELTKLIVARILKDEGVSIEAPAIRSTHVDDGIGTPVLRLSYPLRGLRITVASPAFDLVGLTISHIIKAAREQADAFLHIDREARDLEIDLDEAKVLARREIAKLRRKGLDVSLVQVRPCTVEAGGGWLPSPEIVIEGLSRALMPERISIVCEDENAVGEALSEAPFVKEQLVRAVRRRWLGNAAAGGAIDAVVLAALKAGGVDAATVIKRMREQETGFLVEADGRTINLSWKDGLISGSFRVDERATYKRDELTLDPPLDGKLLNKPSGVPVGSVHPSSLFRQHAVASVRDFLGRTAIAIEPRYNLFDAEGLQPQDRLFPI